MLSKDNKFYKVLRKKANKDNIIILASVDSSFVDLAVNFYETSFRRFNISNFLYICSDSKAVAMLAEAGIDCYLYPQDTKNDQATEYGSKSFILKMRVKMKMVTAALMLGFTTVLSDVDLVFLHDPTPKFYIDSDVSFMSDVYNDNCGFYIARPSNATIELHKRTLTSVMTRMIADQDAMAAAISSMVGSKTLKKKSLNKKEFACGLIYFEDEKRMFLMDKPCNDSTCKTDVVHNNWIVSKAAKIYRFKEMGMWMYDYKKYYSSSSRKYLQYSNALDFGMKSKERERAALKTAMTVAKLLNRTLIFPKFHCYGCKSKACKIGTDHCSFNAHFHVRSFDASFENRYREYVFLKHPMVPGTVKKSVSNEVYVASKDMYGKLNIPKNISIFNTTDYDKGTVSAQDIIKWFGKGPISQFSILKLHSMYFNVDFNDTVWNDSLEKSLKWSDYRQLKKP